MITNKVWKVKPADPSVVLHLQKELGIHPALCRLLALRGISDYDNAKQFFRPRPEDQHDPFLMKGMEQAVSRIQQALQQGEKIMVYGDYDVDGTTAVAVVYAFLQHNFPNAALLFYVPHRYREGYGVSLAGIDLAIQEQVSLLITLDCGIKSVDKIAYAAAHNIDVIVCDHHLPGDHLPQAVAILNPKQPDCSYPYSELSGCGIGYKLIRALAMAYNLDATTTDRYLDLVATSIAADIVPMTGENRVLAYFGLKRANEQPCLALRTLKEIAGMKKEFTIADLVFIVAPRINAAGRMDDARKAIEFFIEENEERSRELAMVLQTDNADRKEQDRNITDEALGMLQEEEKITNKRSTVLFRPYWHKGVVGIVASRLIDHYYRPTVVLTQSNGKVTGSARSVNGFNIYEAIHACADLLENYGGHFFAAGMTMATENLDAFKVKFEEVVGATIRPESLYPELQIDAELSLSEINYKFYNVVQQLEPFGPFNLRPIFISKQVRDFQGSSSIVKEQHLRFIIHQDGGQSLQGIGFGLADKFGYVKNGQPFDIVYTLDENEWNGQKHLQLKVIDIAASGTFC